jgi:hypothetical protein
VVRRHWRHYRLANGLADVPDCAGDGRRAGVFEYAPAGHRARHAGTCRVDFIQQIPRFPIPADRKKALPYGVAIGIGSLLALLWQFPQFGLFG